MRKHFIDASFFRLRTTPYSTIARAIRSELGQIRPWCAIGIDSSLPSDSLRLGVRSVTEAVGQVRANTPSMYVRGKLTGCRFGQDRCTVMISLPSLPRNVRGFIRRLSPDEPFLVEREARYSGPMPRATKHWCIIALALNATMSIVATIVMRSLAPFLIASLASLFPAYMLLFWRDLASTHDDVLTRQEIKFPLATSVRPSMEWIGICLAVVPSLLSIVGTVVAGLHLSQ